MTRSKTSRARTNRNLSGAMVALVLALIALAAIPALAAAAPKEFTVNVTSIGPGTAGCETPGSSEACTLPGAIGLANANPGKDVIRFDPTVFQGAAPFATITLATALPTITEAVELLGGECNTGQGLSGPCVELTLSATASTSILTVAANDVTVEGIAFEGAGYGIKVGQSATGFTAHDDWFGTGLNLGGGAENATAGLRIGPGADAARIGGLTASERNVFARGPIGIELEGASLVKILGNYIGVGPSGEGNVGLETGIKIADSPTFEASFDEIGEALTAGELAQHECVGACNVIATENGPGIDLGGYMNKPGSAAGGPTRIVGNYLGLAAEGQTVIGNSGSGVAAIPPAADCTGGPGEVTVGGPEPTEANFIDGGGAAIAAEQAADLNVIGNNIGMAADGAQVDGPQFYGVELCNTGVSDGARITGNRMMLGPNAVGVQTIDGDAQISGNSILGGHTGVELITTNGEGPVLVSGNQINGPAVDGILIESSANVITGNAITAAEHNGIEIATGAEGNRLGGDAAGEANIIVGTGVEGLEEEAAITIFGEQMSHNEVAANFGSGNIGPFIQLIGHGGAEEPNNGIQPPAFTTVLQSSASGTAAPEATVRVFSKGTPEAGELEELLAVVKAGPTGAWAATFAKQPLGALVAATATSDAGTPEGATSEVSAPVAAAADPVKPEEPEKEKEKEGGGSGGGGTTGGGTSNGSSSSSSSTPPPPATGAPAAPTVKITKGPKKSSTATTAKFVFKATPAAGATFECKLDNAKWAKCKSPKTYKNLKPGRHTFQVRASVPGAPASKPAKFQFTVKP